MNLTTASQASRHWPQIFRVFALALVALLTLGLVFVSAQPVTSAPRVSVSVADRPGENFVADSTYLTEVNVSGNGFQSIKNGFGGIYVLFGWATAGWQPSAGGKVGSHYRYVYDDESNPVGYQLFVTFPGSSTAYAANGGTLNADGTWNARMKIPGPKFQAYDRNGNVTNVDCTQVQCGIITIGAHGVINPDNESFTPINFKTIYTSGEGRQTAVVGEPKVNAVAPTIIGGRPAVIPTALTPDAVAAEQDGGVTVEPGQTRLTITVPESNTEEWLGIYLYSDPLFTGWFKPNSEGVIDVNIPGNLEEGAHRAVIMNTDGEVRGWSEFEFSLAAETPNATTPDQNAAPLPGAPMEDNSLLLYLAIGVGILALLSVILLVVMFIRGPKRVAPSSDNTNTDS